MSARAVPIKVVPDMDHGPGWAWMTLSGIDADALPGHAQSSAADWTLTLQRNQDSYFLVSDSSWGAGEVWHHVHQWRLTPEGVQFLLGPELLDAVLADPRTVCRVEIRGQGPSQAAAFAGVLRFDRGVLPSGASGQSPSAAQRAPAPQPKTVAAVVPPEPILNQPVPVVEVPVEPPAPESAPTSQTSPTSSKWRWLWILLLVLLVGAGTAYWWWQSSVRDPIGGSGVVSGTVSPAACSPQALQAATDDLIFLQACVAVKPDSKTVLSVIEAAKKAQRCDLIQRLYAHQAQAGQVDVALAYAREFDPATFKGGCFKQADAQTALYWYENILQANPGRTDIAARVKELEAIK